MQASAMLLQNVLALHITALLLYCFIAFRSENDSNFLRAITLSSYNGSKELEAITFFRCAKRLSLWHCFFW
jgi:hypothetical protein